MIMWTTFIQLVEFLRREDIRDAVVYNVMYYYVLLCMILYDSERFCVIPRINFIHLVEVPSS